MRAATYGCVCTSCQTAPESCLQHGSSAPCWLCAGTSALGGGVPGLEAAPRAQLCGALVLERFHELGAASGAVVCPQCAPSQELWVQDTSAWLWSQAWDFFWCLTLFLFFLKTSSAHRKSLEVLQAGTFAFHNPACGHSAVASALEQQLLLFPLYVTWMLSLLKSGNVGHKYDNVEQAGISAIMHIFTINVFEKS